YRPRHWTGPQPVTGDGGEKHGPGTPLVFTPTLPLSAVGFLSVVIMSMLAPDFMSLSLLLPAVSRGLGQRQPRQGGCLLRRHRHNRPGFGDEVPHGQWGAASVKPGTAGRACAAWDGTTAPQRRTHNGQRASSPNPALRQKGLIPLPASAPRCTARLAP